MSNDSIIARVRARLFGEPIDMTRPRKASEAPGVDGSPPPATSPQLDATMRSYSEYAVDRLRRTLLVSERGLMPAPPTHLINPAQVEAPRAATVQGHALTGERFRLARAQLMGGEHHFDRSGVVFKGERVLADEGGTLHEAPTDFSVVGGVVADADKLVGKTDREKALAGGEPPPGFVSVAEYGSAREPHSDDEIGTVCIVNRRGATIDELNNGFWHQAVRVSSIADAWKVIDMAKAR